MTMVIDSTPKMSDHSPSVMQTPRRIGVVQMVWNPCRISVVELRTIVLRGLRDPWSAFGSTSRQFQKSAMA